MGVKEFCDTYGVHENRVYRAFEKGWLNSYKYRGYRNREFLGIVIDEKYEAFLNRTREKKSVRTQKNLVDYRDDLMGIECSYA